MKLIVTFFLLLSICLSIAQPPSQKRTLVLYQKTITRANFSQYFQQLEADGFTLTYRSLEDQRVQLSNYGEYLYDNIIILANSLLDSAKGVNVDRIAEFLDAGNNLLVATDHQSSLYINDLVGECGVQLDKEGHQAIDHTNFEASNGDPTLFLAENYIDLPVIVGDVKAPILYRGAGLAIFKENPLVIPVLRGSPSTYSYFPNSAYRENSNSQFAGKNLLLVSALQARNNARMIVSGSLEMFSNRFFDSLVQKQGSTEQVKTGNKEFVGALSRWAFRQQGFLKLSETSYKRVEERDRPGFRVKDTLAFETKISEWNGKEWVPYLGGGFQIEFIRLDPHVRLTLEHDNTGRYFVTFQVPDVYGVFTLRLIHGNLGYSFSSWKESVSVRPFRHDEYERFIVTAYPYYLSAFSMMFGFGIFSFFFLYYRSAPLK